jgi:hypothetical protein
MLTTDLVRARRSGDELRIVPLSGKQRERAHELAQTIVETAKEYLGRPREELLQAWSDLEAGFRERRIVAALCKLVEDACEFSAEATTEPSQLRERLFSAATESWQRLEPGQGFDRTRVVTQVAAELGVSVEEIERGLYADLRGAHLLARVPEIGATRLIEHYDEAQIAAVLLRAVKVVATVRCSAPAAYRALFHKLKFRRLLYAIEPADEARYRIVIDGPYSLFDSITKYGLSLALVLPALKACDELELLAHVRWGKQRTPLVFRYQGGAAPLSPLDEPVIMSDELMTLVSAFRALGGAWQVEPATDILQLPGVGLCVPDLVFVHDATHARVFLEVMGYWSRDAVWRRVELARAGLSERVLFAVSSRLRVSEAVLETDAHAALYVYKGTMSARAIEKKLDQLASR